jgi:hypothetical protein
LQPKIAPKLHRKVCNFLFFPTFVSICGISMYQVVYVCGMPIYQIVHTLKKAFFKKENQQKWLENV